MATTVSSTSQTQAISTIVSRQYTNVDRTTEYKCRLPSQYQQYPSPKPNRSSSSTTFTYNVSDLGLNNWKHWYSHIITREQKRRFDVYFQFFYPDCCAVLCQCRNCRQLEQCIDYKCGCLGNYYRQYAPNPSPNFKSILSISLAFAVTLLFAIYFFWRRKNKKRTCASNFTFVDPPPPTHTPPQQFTLRPVPKKLVRVLLPVHLLIFKP
jgi:hypothetical protein